MTKSKNELDILRLKLTKNNLEIAKEQHAIGSREFTDILKGFEKNIQENQQEKYRNFFFGNETKPSKETSTETGLQVYDEVVSQSDIKKEDLPRWVKKMYRKIMQSTHPDKFINFPVEAIKEKFVGIYREAVEALEDNDIGIIILCAYEVNIEIDEPGALKYVQDSLNSKHHQFEHTQTLLGYQWYHVKDEDRESVLSNYLRQLGYTFTVEQVKQVSNKKRVRRKTGERPEKIFVNRRKIK